MRSPTGTASSARRGAGRGRGVACPAAAGGGRDLLPARHHRPGARAWRRGATCPASSGGGRGIIGPARPVRGDLSSAAGCCCPLLYSYVGRRGAISYRRGIIEPLTENAPRKRATKKEVGAAAGRVYLFFRVIFPGRSFFRGVVRGGRLESIAGHSFPRGVHDIPRHAFPGALCRRFHLLVFFRHQSRCNCLEFG